MTPEALDHMKGMDEQRLRTIYILVVRDIQTIPSLVDLKTALEDELSSRYDTDDEDTTIPNPFEV